MKTAVFCDFDGTIARRDIGYHLFHHFSGGRNDELVPRWKSGQLTTRDCLLQEAAMVTATPREIYRFLDGFELNRGFAEFVQLCQSQKTDLIVTSDGLEFYIRYVLKRHGISGLPVLANVGKLHGGGLTVEFPYDNKSCDRCGNCKGERIREYRSGNTSTRIVFVGDGYSDACATGEADLIFAKKDLVEYCRENNIGFVEYDDFFDVARHMIEQGYLTARGLKQANGANQ